MKNQASVQIMTQRQLRVKMHQLLPSNTTDSQPLTESFLQSTMVQLKQVRDKIIAAIEADKSEKATAEDIDNEKMVVDNAVQGLSMDKMT